MEVDLAEIKAAAESAPSGRRPDWFRVYIVDFYTKEARKMTEESFEYFVAAIEEFLDELHSTYKDFYEKFLVYYDGRHQCRVGQALRIHSSEHPEWHVRVMRPPCHIRRSASKYFATSATNKLLPNAILVLRDDRFQKPEVESYIGFAVRHKITNSDTCFRVQILLPQLQSQSFLL